MAHFFAATNNEVERGETFIITRHGRAIARIVPEVNRRQEEVDRSLASILELRKRTLKVSIEEILSAKKEGTSTDAVRA